MNQRTEIRSNVVVNLTDSCVGSGGSSAPPKVLICRGFGQNLKNIGQRSFDIF